MTKVELIKLFKEATQLNGVQTEEFFARLMDIMTAELLAGGEVPLPGIGKLKIKETAARKGRNPHTNKTIDIPAGRKVVLSVGKEFKEALK